MPKASPSSSSTDPLFSTGPRLLKGVPTDSFTRREESLSHGGSSDTRGVFVGMPQLDDNSTINWISSLYDDKENRCGPRSLFSHQRDVPVAPTSFGALTPHPWAFSTSRVMHGIPTQAGFSARMFATKKATHFLVREDRSQRMKRIISAGKWVGEKSLQLLKALWSVSRKTGQMVLALVRDPKVVHVWWQDIKEGTAHMIKWTATGFRLFGANIRISKRLALRSAQGHGLTLRERKLLVRTTGDIFKIIPFSFFIIIPFAELLLPVFIRIFPNMLPSTFFENSYDNATLSRKLKAKQEMASFFQEVVQRRTKQILQEEDHADFDRAKELQVFQQKLMEGTEFPSAKEVLRFSKLFKNEFKFENMDSENLESMCRILGLKPGHFRPQLVLQLRHHVTGLRMEDRDLLWEGIEHIPETELIEHCKARAIRFDVDADKMREWLGYWLELSSHKQISISLLLWCQTFFISSDEYVKKAMMVDTRVIDQGQTVPVSEEPAQAFSKMKERRQVRLEEAEEQLEELKRELKSMEEKSMEETVVEDHALRKEMGMDVSGVSETVHPLRKDARRSTLDERVHLNDVSEVEVFDEDLHNFSSLEVTQLAKVALFREISSLQEQRDHGVKLATKQHRLLKILLEFISQMRQNEPTINKDPDRILLDQRARLVQMWHQFGDDLETIEKEHEILLKLSSRQLPKEVEEAIRRLELPPNLGDSDGTENETEDLLQAHMANERIKTRVSM